MRNIFGFYDMTNFLAMIDSQCVQFTSNVLILLFSFYINSNRSLLEIHGSLQTVRRSDIFKQKSTSLFLFACRSFGCVDSIFVKSRIKNFCLINLIFVSHVEDSILVSCIFCYLSFKSLFFLFFFCFILRLSWDFVPR